MYFMMPAKMAGRAQERPLPRDSHVTAQQPNASRRAGFNCWKTLFGIISSCPFAILSMNANSPTASKASAPFIRVDVDTSIVSIDTLLLRNDVCEVVLIFCSQPLPRHSVGCLESPALQRLECSELVGVSCYEASSPERVLPCCLGLSCSLASFGFVDAESLAQIQQRVAQNRLAAAVNDATVGCSLRITQKQATSTA